MHGFISLEQAGGFGLPLDVDRSFDRVTSALVATFTDWPPPEPNRRDKAEVGRGKGAHS